MAKLEKSLKIFHYQLLSIFFLPSQFNKLTFKDMNFCEFMPPEKLLGYTIGVQGNDCQCHSLHIEGISNHLLSLYFVKGCEP